MTLTPLSPLSLTFTFKLALAGLALAGPACGGGHDDAYHTTGAPAEGTADPRADLAPGKGLARSASPSSAAGATVAGGSAAAGEAWRTCRALAGESCCDPSLADLVSPDDVVAACEPGDPYEGESSGGGCWRWFGTGPGKRHSVTWSVADARTLPLAALVDEWKRTGARVETLTGASPAPAATVRAERTGVTGPTLLLAGEVSGRVVVVEADSALCQPEAVEHLYARAVAAAAAVVVPPRVF
jgi:hypothetical protein